MIVQDYSFFISSTALISCCFFCSVMLWIASRHSMAKKTLAVSFSVSTVYNTYFVVKTLNTTNYATEIFDFSYGLFCLFLVYIAFLYFRTLMLPQPHNKPIIWQMIIFFVAYGALYGIITLTCRQTVHLYSIEAIKEYAEAPVVWLRIWIFLHFIVATIVLCIFTLRMYRKHRMQISSLFSYSEDINLSWLPYILASFIIVGIGTSFDISLPLSGIKLDISNYAYTVFNMAIGFMAAFQKDIYGSQNQNEDVMSSQKDYELEEQRYEKSNFAISSITRLRIKNEMLALMEEEKIYLNPGLCIDYMIKRLGANRTYLSLIFREDFGKSFIEFVNFYRIEEAKRLISQKSNYASLSQIAEIVGFKSISSFNTFFKRFTGQTPTEYRKSYAENE